MKKLPEPRFRLPRIWSNQELRKVASLFHGDVVNVSAWRDEDKEGGFYRDYFKNANSYTLTNFKSEARGFQGVENEIFLDLTDELPAELEQRFDVVFNHTTLEHVFDIDRAFTNLCRLSKDVVIVVVPFLQEMHGEYGDFWRFTPLAIKKLFEKNSMEVIHLTFNRHKNSSIYIFAIASRKPELWNAATELKIEIGLSKFDKPENVIGYNAIYERQPSSFDRIISRLKFW